jgi:hypothetical protein
MANDSIRTFHDEPFIVDNFPLEMDIGKEHSDRNLIDEPASGGTVWTRRESHLDHIVVLSTDGRSKTDKFHVLTLDTSRPVKLSMQNTRVLDVSLSLHASDPHKSFLTISPSPGTFKLTRQGRRLKQATGASRIIEVIVPLPKGDTEHIRVGPGPVYVAFFLGKG